MKAFFVEFRNDHRQIRDVILDLISAFSQRDMNLAGDLLAKLNAVAGPHFIFEEQSLYQKLIVFYGLEYVDKLYRDHDLLIARVKAVKKIIENNDPGDEDVEKGIHHLRGLLPHLSDCEGLTIMMEKFEEKEITRIHESMQKARLMNTGLLEWSEKGRPRKPLLIP